MSDNLLAVLGAEDSSNVQNQLSEASFFQGAGGKGHRPELAPPAAAILCEIDPQVCLGCMLSRLGRACCSQADCHPAQFLPQRTSGDSSSLSHTDSVCDQQ